MLNSKKCCTFPCTIWTPRITFDHHASVKHAIVILNTDIHLKTDLVIQLWQTAKVKVTVDGGTDQWFQFINKNLGFTIEHISHEYLPDMITGDFDSISSNTLKKVQDMGLNVISTLDQSETDYTKALQQLKQHCEFNNVQLDYIYVISEHSERFDHIMGNINTLYKCNKFLENVKVVHISKNSFTWLLSKGKHIIQIPELLVNEKSWCGIIPFENCDNCISTTGLKWNLNKQCLKFGELVSTSNTYVKQEITIDTNANVIWTMDIEPIVKNYESTISNTVQHSL